MPRQSEPSANNALRDLLQPMLSRSEVRSENTQFISGHPGLKPDIIVTAPGRSPVVIEAEYLPAANVENEAIDRLGMEVNTVGRPIEAAIALRYSLKVRDADDLHAALRSELLSYCIFTGLPDDLERFPASGWLEGGVEDLADLVQLVSVPRQAVRIAAMELQAGIDKAAKVLGEVDKVSPGITEAIARLLAMRKVEQTYRMASAIIANALVFHERIAGMHNGIKPLSIIMEDPNPKQAALDAWRAILKINYWSIFAIARDLLGQLQSGYATQVLKDLSATAQRVNATGIDNAHDLTGRVFQRLISDRKYLATFYTLPPSAALLARLAVAKMQGVKWADPKAVGKLRIGDFACGTGALLSAVYEQIAARHERTGGDPAKLHEVMMEEVFYGCDVMPSAVHITGSTLSGLEPSVSYGKSRIYNLAYGRQSDGDVKIGSLELLRSSAAPALFNTSDPALRTGSAGEETAAYIIADIKDAGYDLVIMNPPFTNATNHEGAHADVTNPAFAAFDASRIDQRIMGKRLNKLGDKTCYSGNAGLASAFAALADRKLKPGGVLALVLPLSVASGLAWEAFRKLLAEHYTEIFVVSISANGREMSFSSDTGMAECLVIARKLKAKEKPAKAAHFTSMTRRPKGLAESSAAFKSFGTSGKIRGIADGPYGGTARRVGSEAIGNTLTVPAVEISKHWGAVRVSDYALAQVSHALAGSKLWLPGTASSLGLPIVLLGKVGSLGLVHRDIIGSELRRVPKGKPDEGKLRGPFDRVDPSPTATYPSLWNHDAISETRMICSPDSQLEVRQNMEEEAAEVWTTATRSHLNLDFTFGSQPLAVAFTDTESIGGRVWPNVGFGDKRFDHALSVWGNSTLGLLLYWWHANRQQSSKASMTIRSAESLPVLDFRALTDAQLAKAQEIFEEFRDKELQPAYLADADPNRALLDKRVVCDLLGFDQATYEGVRRLAAKWCAEPSVHGGKKRPKGATLVM